MTMSVGEQMQDYVMWVQDKIFICHESSSKSMLDDIDVIV